jgi:hypothetical protein
MPGHDGRQALNFYVCDLLVTFEPMDSVRAPMGSVSEFRAAGRRKE